MATRKPKSKGAGSPTNASSAVDNVHVPEDPTTDQLLDAGIKETFPASDPVSVEPTHTAHECEVRGKDQPAPPSPQQRSPDWLLSKKH